MRDKESEFVVRKWCHFTGTAQDFPDVCLVTRGVLSKDADSDSSLSVALKEPNGEDRASEYDETYKYYGWYKITFTKTKKSIYRRLRKATSREGYPDNCLVLDPYSSNELGLDAINVYALEEKKRRREYFHYRNSLVNIAKKSLSYDDTKGIQHHLAHKGKGKKLYFITGFPVYPLKEPEKILLDPVPEHTVFAAIGQTVGHPDYSIRLASKIAIISLLIALISLVSSFASIFASSGPDEAVVERLDAIEQHLTGQD